LSFTLRRRRFFGAAGGFALAPSLAPAPASAATPDWPLVEGKDTPKLCLGTGRSGDPKDAIALWRQILAEAPADASWRPVVEDAIAALEGSGTKPQAATGS